MLLFERYAEHYFALEGRRATLLRDIRGLLRLFRDRADRRLLDLGCGTGEHAAVLNRAGMEVAGIDLSPAMIAVARERFPGLSCAVADLSDERAANEFAERSVRNAGDRRVAAIDGAYSLFGTFNYLHDVDAVLRAFRGLAKALRDGGRLVLEIWNPEAYRGLPSRLPITERTIRSGDLKIRRSRRVRFDAGAPDFVLIQHEYETEAIPGRPETQTEEHRLRLYAARELESLAEKAGLRLRATHADLSANSPISSSAALLLVFEK